MTTVISPSTLWWALTCPYKYFNATYNIDPLNVIHWYLWNVSAETGIIKTNNKLWPRVRYYDNIVNSRLGKKKLNIDSVKKWMFNVYSFFKDLANDDIQIYQEMKVDFPFYEDWSVWISWQPDIMVLYNKPNEDICWEVFDIKVWKNSWYDHEDIWTENQQRIIYSRFMYKLFDQEINSMWIKNPKIKFSFAVMDKWTWDFNLHSRTVDFRFVELQVKTRVEEFLKIKQSDIAKENYPAKKCRACAFCDFNWTCPLAKQSLDLEEKTIDDLF